MQRHKRFLWAFGFGALVASLSLMLPLTNPLRALLGANAFFVVYLALMLQLAQSATPQALRSHAEVDDIGIPFILLLAAAAVGISLTSIILVLNGPGGGGLLPRLMALAAVPLGWSTVQVLIGFHYAHLFYRPDGDGIGGLVFPGQDAPGPWDFLYFSFGIGMAAQVSDVTTNTSGMRRAVLAHSVSAFFYNTIIVALAVNAAVTAAL